jgi:hypothetical protein
MLAAIHHQGASMEMTDLSANRDFLRDHELRQGAGVAAATSGVSWGAIFAGAAGAAALTLLLLMLGVGLGLSSVSPWSDKGASAAAIGVATIVWLTFTQLAASGMGGYLAGRLRTKWAAVHTDEVYFRDTAHGFLAWAVASLATAAFLGGSVGAIVSGGAQAGASLAGGAASAATVATAGAAAGAAGSATSNGNTMGSSMANGQGYFVDALFRKDPSAPAADANAQQPAAPVGEVGRIFATSLRTGTLAPDDTHYVGQLVAQRTGLSQADAEKRVSDTFAKAQAQLKQAETSAQEAADKARKTSAYATLWMFVSLLIGAFVASFAATLGGRRRDMV